jgi:hypothetical protein
VTNARLGKERAMIVTARLDERPRLQSRCGIACLLPVLARFNAVLPLSMRPRIVPLLFFPF